MINRRRIQAYHRGPRSRTTPTGPWAKRTLPLANIKKIVAKYQSVLYVNSQGTSLSSHACEAEVLRSHTAQVFKVADDAGDQYRYREYPGENFDENMWLAECTAGHAEQVRRNTADTDPLIETTVEDEPHYDIVDLNLGAAATGCFGDWATWSAGTWQYHEATDDEAASQEWIPSRSLY